MFNLFSKRKIDESDLSNSSLFNETIFYKAFIRDLSRCTHEAIIERPHISLSSLFLNRHPATG